MILLSAYRKIAGVKLNYTMKILRSGHFQYLPKYATRNSGRQWQTVVKIESVQALENKTLKISSRNFFFRFVYEKLKPINWISSPCLLGGACEGEYEELPAYTTAIMPKKITIEFILKGTLKFYWFQKRNFAWILYFF